MALFIDVIGAPAIDFGSAWFIYQLLNAFNTEIYGLGSTADFLNPKKDAAEINL